MAATTEQEIQRSIIPSFLRDIRVLQIIGQISFVVIVAVLFSSLASTASTEMRARGLVPNFSFIELRAGFDIDATDKPDWYSSDNSYGDAFRVGMLNTLRVVSIGLVAATVLGVLFGIFLLSSNWLIRTLSRTYVELLRNTPLLVQIFAWFFIVMSAGLPTIDEAITFPAEGIASISLRLVIYLVIYLVARRYITPMSVDDPRRVGANYGLLAAFVVTEFAFWQFHNNANWPLAYGSGDFGNGTFLLYAAISVLLIAASWFGLSGRWRALGLGITGGQFVAGLLFYFGIMPDPSFQVELYPAFYLSKRGFVFPELLPTARFGEWLAFVGLGVLLAVFLWLWFGRVIETTGRAIPRGLYAILAIIGFAVVGWFLVGTEPLPETIQLVQDDAVVLMSLEEAQEADLLTTEDLQQYSTAPLIGLIPEQNRFNRFLVGNELSPKFMALLLALVVYTSAFIAEIVRAGIQAVPHGQIEAARALGLSQSQVLSQIVLPQALRVIIPPMGNQYLNLSKNSSLAIGIGFADVFMTSNTIMNQSGQTITTFFIIMIFYLVISLFISAVMNWINRRFQLVTR